MPEPLSPAPEPVDGDALMADIARPTLGRTLVMSVGVHAVVILLTSIQFIILCAKHDTLHPRAVLKQLKEEAHQTELEAKREAAKAQILAQHAKEKAAAKDSASEKAGTATETGKAPILKELEKKSSEKPKEPDVSLDKDLGLE